MGFLVIVQKSDSMQLKLNRYHNLSGAITDLRSRGYVDSFRLNQDKLQCLRTQKNYVEEDMQVIEYHRFLSKGKPDESSILLVVECHDGLKGLVTSSYGTYYDIPLMKFIDKVKIKPNAGAN